MTRLLPYLFVILILSACHSTISKEEVKKFEAELLEWEKEATTYEESFNTCASQFLDLASMLEDSIGDQTYADKLATDSLLQVQLSQLEVKHLHWASANKVLFENQTTHNTSTRTWAKSLVQNGVSEEVANRQWEERKATTEAIRERRGVVSQICTELTTDIAQIKETIQKTDPESL